MASQTLWMLMAQFDGRATVRLDEISNDYFALSPVKAAAQAIRCTLPVPAFRMQPSQKAPWLVHLSDLAMHIDNCRAAAAKDNIHRAA
jgi:hypothetical protein